MRETEEHVSVSQMLVQVHQSKDSQSVSQSVQHTPGDDRKPAAATALLSMAPA